MQTANRALTRLVLAVPIALALPAASASEAITIEDAYVRAVPPGQPNSAAFMILTNTSGEDRALLAAQSDAAEVVELHTHRMEDGMMRMRKIDQIELPAGEVVKLEPGGLHVMLIGLTGQLEPGDEVALNLGFDDGSQQSLTAPVKRISHGMGGGGHQHGD
jgi:hypothetical protein